MKYFDMTLSNQTLVDISGANWSSTMTLDPSGRGTLFFPALGNDIDQRIGKKVRIHKVTVRGHIRSTQSTLSSPQDANHIRILLVVNKQTNGITLSPVEVLSSGSATQGNINAFANFNFFGKYRILKDKHIFLQNPQLVGAIGGSNVEAVGLIRPFKFVHKFKKPFIVHFNAGDRKSVV